jgi:hypothetical protein
MRCTARSKHGQRPPYPSAFRAVTKRIVSEVLRSMGRRRGLADGNLWQYEPEHFGYNSLN